MSCRTASWTKVGLLLLLSLLLGSWSSLVPQAQDPADPNAERDANRDPWQRPEEVLDALRVRTGDWVADIGSGSGYFTFKMAYRVSSEGKVYSVEIDESDLNIIRHRKQKENVSQIELVLGEHDDPHLPASSLNAILVVDSYHEFRQYDAMMRKMFEALKPCGLLGIIDGKARPARPRSYYYERHSIAAETVREDAARHGFAFLESRPGFYDAEYNKDMYFLVFEKPKS